MTPQQSNNYTSQVDVLPRRERPAVTRRRARRALEQGLEQVMAEGALEVSPGGEPLSDFRGVNRVRQRKLVDRMLNKQRSNHRQERAIERLRASRSLYASNSQVVKHVPVTHHLPYLRDQVVDRRNAHRFDYGVDQRFKDWSPETLEAYNLYSSVSNSSNPQLDASRATWGQTRATGAYVAHKSQEVRLGVRVFNPERDFIPLHLLSNNQCTRIRRVASAFSLKPKADRLAVVLRNVDYTDSGARRIGLNAAMTQLVMGYLPRMQRQMRSRDWQSLISSAEVYSVALNYVPPQLPEERPYFAKKKPVGQICYQMAPLPIPLAGHDSMPGFEVLETMREHAPALVRVFSLVHLIYTSKRSVPVWISAFMLYLSEDAISFLMDFAKVFISQVFTDGITPQVGAGDQLDDMLFAPSSVFFRTPLARAAWDLFGSFSVHNVLASLGLLSDSTAVGRAFRFCQPYLKRGKFGEDANDTFLYRVASIGKIVISRVKLCVETRSLEPFFAPEILVSEWMAWADFLLYDPTVLYEPSNLANTENFKKKQEQGLVPYFIANQLTKEQLEDQFRACAELGPKLAEKHKEDTTLSISISRQRDALKLAAIDLSLDTPRGAFRMEPFGIMLFGPPGVGKSTICERLHHACSHAMGFRSDPSGMLRHDGSANFADGAMRGQTTILFDDIDARVAPPSAGHDDHVSTVNKYINVAPFNIEQASLEKKGKVWACFALAMYTTNYHDCHLKDYTKKPAMFWRRFPWRIRSSVKQQYATESGSLDTSKLPEGNADLYDHLVEKFTPSMTLGDTYTPPYTSFKTFTTDSSFFAFITSEFKSHVERERRKVTRSNRDRSKIEVCEICHLPEDEHVTECEVGIQMYAAGSSTPPISREEADIRRFRETIYGNSTENPDDYTTWSTSTRRNLGLLFVACATIGTFAGVYESRRGHHATPWWRQVIRFRQDYTAWLGVLANTIMLTLGFYSAAWWSAINLWSYFMVPNLDWVAWDLLMRRPRMLTPRWVRLLYARLHMPIIANLSRANQIFALREYERAISFLDFRHRIGPLELRNIEIMGVGISIILPAIAMWVSRSRADKGLSYQMDANGERIYKTPVGIPKSSSPYVRKMETDFLSQPYGVRETPASYTFRELEAKIKERMCSIITKRGSVFGFRIAGSMIVTVSHTFMEDKGLSGDYTSGDFVPGPFSISVGTTVYLKPQVIGFIQRVPGRDLVLLHCPEVPPISSKWDFPGMLNHSEPIAGLMSDECWLITGDETYNTNSAAISWIHPLHPRKMLWRYDAPTVEGDCGGVLIIRRGAHFSIAGFHIAYMRMSGDESYAMAEVLTGPVYRQLAASWADVGASLEIQVDTNQILGRPIDHPLKRLPFKSSLAATLSFADRVPEVLVLGTLSEIAGSTTRSRIVDTYFRKDPAVRSLETGLGGFPYFTSPTFTGSMENNRWVDPFTVNLEAISNVSGRPEIWDLALNDYLYMGTPKVARVQPLSDYSAFMGVADTVIGGTNMQSSTGVPFNTKKSQICHVEYGEDATLSWDAGFERQVREIERVIRGGALYSPFCSHVLKDEVISVAKNLKHKVRVFNILPFAYNLLMKKYLAPLVAVLLEHSQFFETVVGANIADAKTANTFGNFLSRYPNCLAFDKSSFDAKCSTYEHITVCRFFLYWARMCGYSEEDAQFVFRICLSAIYPIRSIKGDLFMLSCSMPSGFWMTIHFNCVRSSLQARYAWYRINPQAPPFRTQVNQLVLGDDLLATVSTQSHWYNQVNIGRALEEVGAVVTSWEKKDVLVEFEGTRWPGFHAIESVQFLKRSPRWDGKQWRWALDQKTLIKMLCMRQRSANVPDTDAHAMLLSNVVAESYLWGREVFSEYWSLCQHLANKFHLEKNAYLRLADYDWYEVRYMGGDYAPWVNSLLETADVSTLSVVVKEARGLEGTATEAPTFDS